MNKLNCWEVKKCGREVGGEKAALLGVCPVAAEKNVNGLNGGINGGRICWVLAEEHFKNEISCSKLTRKDPCFSCEFRYKVTAEEGLLNVCRATGFFLKFINISKSCTNV